MNSYRASKGKRGKPIGWADLPGVVYLLHFDKPHHHAQHYLGFSQQLETRLGKHFSGNGTGLTRVIKEQANNHAVLARTWPHPAGLGPVPDSQLVDQCVEMVLKARAESPRLCPICNPDKALSLARYYTVKPTAADLDGQDPDDCEWWKHDLGLFVFTYDPDLDLMTAAPPERTDTCQTSLATLEMLF